MEMQNVPKCHHFQAAFIKAIIMADEAAPFSWKFCSSFQFYRVLFHGPEESWKSKSCRPVHLWGKRKIARLNIKAVSSVWSSTVNGSAVIQDLPDLSYV